MGRSVGEEVVVFPRDRGVVVLLYAPLGNRWLRDGR